MVRPQQQRLQRPGSRRTRAVRRRSSRKETIEEEVNNISAVKTVAKDKTVGLQNLPVDVLERVFLYIADAPNLDRSLGGRSLDNFEYLIWLAQAHPVFLLTLRYTFHSLMLKWGDTVAPNEISLLSGSLRDLSIDSETCTQYFLQALLPTPPPIRMLNLQNVSIGTISLPDVLEKANLTSLRLSFITMENLCSDLQRLSPRLGALQSLDLRGLSDLDDKTLLQICEVAGPSLTNLTLRYLRHESLKDHVLRRISHVCPNVHNIELESIRHMSPTGVIALCTEYSSQLRTLHLQETHVPKSSLTGLISRCPNLEHFGIGDSELQTSGVDDIVETLGMRSRTLSSVELLDVEQMEDADLEHLALLLPKLNSLKLSNCFRLSSNSMIRFAEVIGTRLRKLDVRGPVFSDCALARIGEHCTKLEEVALGSSNEQTLIVALEYVSNSGIDALLKGCGNTLRRFTWKFDRRSQVALNVSEWWKTVTEKLQAVALAQSLSRLCPKLEYVEVDGLIPPFRTAEKALGELAFLELDETRRHVNIFLDEYPLHSGART